MCTICYYFQNEVSYDRGTWKVLYFLPKIFHVGDGELPTMLETTLEYPNSLYKSPFDNSEPFSSEDGEVG